MAKNRNRQSVIQKIMSEADERLKSVNHNLTRRQYHNNFKRYVQYCRNLHPECKTFESCREYIQEYSDLLVSKKYTPSTIHTYIAAVCMVYSINMNEIMKPIRHTSQNIRGRSNSNEKAYRSARDPDNPKYKRLAVFARMVGLREAELFKLRKNDLKYDSDGYLCVCVSGKGGKFQQQRLLPKYIEQVRTYFDGIDGFVFERELMRNELNIHKMRADCAKEYYEYTLNRIINESGYADQLEKEIIKRWNEFNISKSTGKPKPFDHKKIEGNYILRGLNRQKAIAEGKPFVYNKLAVMATSMFKLSHFRNDVTVANYLSI